MLSSVWKKKQKLKTTVVQNILPKLFLFCFKCVQFDFNLAHPCHIHQVPLTVGGDIDFDQYSSFTPFIARQMYRMLRLNTLHMRGIITHHKKKHIWEFINVCNLCMCQNS